jgi:predicted dehydrogenase
VKLAVLDPGHFHAALVQKTMYPGIEPTVRVYAPAGPDLEDYLRKVEVFNTRADNPTRWRIEKYVGDDFLDRFAADRGGDVVVIAGNNRRKTEYLTRAVEAGIHTLADKPMAIDATGFAALEQAFSLAQARKVLLYDIMTERYEITSILQREFAAIAPIFGDLDCGTADDPGVVKESVHHFSKLVAGAALQRPGWFFDTAQQGEGLVDITTHLVDLIQWACFPGAALDYRKDVRIVRAKRWATAITPTQFTDVTRLPPWPEYLRKDVGADGMLNVFANGRIDYTIRGVRAQVSVLWNFAAPLGTGDTHYSLLRGTRASLVIRQGEAERYVPTLYVEPHATTSLTTWQSALKEAMPRVQAKFPGIESEPAERGVALVVPAKYHVGHEAHFGQVTEQFLRYVAAGALPAWEVPNMLAKYYTTTQALASATRTATGSEVP